MTPEQKVERARKDFPYFLALLWAFLGLPAPTRAQYALARELQNGSGRSGTLGYRGWGKSWICGGFAVWKLWLNRGRRVLVISANADRAADFSRFCKRIIAEWELLAELRPDGNSLDSLEKWDVGGAPPHQSPSVKSVGIMGQITGSRATDIIFDDVEVPKNVETVLMREKLASRVTEAAAVIVKPDDPTGWVGGEGEEYSVRMIHYLGTPQCEDTLYSKLPARGYDIMIWPARYPDKKLIEAYEKMGARLFPEILDDLERDPSLVGQPADPRRLTEAELYAVELEYGRTGFQLQFMLNPSLSDAEKYPLRTEDLIVCDVDFQLGPQQLVWAKSQKTLLEDLQNFWVGLAGDKLYGPAVDLGDAGYAPWEGTHMAIDPAGGGKDETSFVVTKFMHGWIYLVDLGAWKRHSADTAVLTALAEVGKKWGVGGNVTIESNMGDGMYTRLLSPVWRKATGIPLDPNRVDVRHTARKERRIIDTLSPVMERHRLVMTPGVIRKDRQIVYSDEPTDRHIQRSLLYQMTRLCDEKGALMHDDRLDALAMGVAHWRDRMGVDEEEAIEERIEAQVKAIAERSVLDYLPNIEGPPKVKSGWLA